MTAMTQKPVIGILTLGQTPRPDLVAAVRAIVPNAELPIRGGFDGLSMEEIERFRAGPGAAYSLMVRLANGSTIDVDMYDLLPNLVKQAELLAQAGAGQIVLMCSGGFAEFESPVPVIRPVSLFQAYAGILSVRKRIGIVNPIQAQMASAAAYWQELGYTVCSDFASPFKLDEVQKAVSELEKNDVDLIMLDCMGFTHEALDAARQCVTTPVLLPVKLLQTFFAALY